METVFFLGSCSCEGFVSHYDSLFQEVKTLNIIKGGSGCGKSTFMRSIGRAAQDRGMDVGYILCSSDPDSLDGVLIPRLSLAYVDGTAPHVLEPLVCAGSANYINFGSFYDREGILANEEELFSLRNKNQTQYALAHSCLGAVGALIRGIQSQTDSPNYEEELKAIANCLCLSALPPKMGKGKLSRRFLSAVTPLGLRICHQSPKILCPKVYALQDRYFLAPRLLAYVQEKALAQGYDCIAGYSPLQAKGAPAYLLIPEAGAAFVSHSKLLPYEGDSFCSIDLDSTVPAPLKQDLQYTEPLCRELLLATVKHLLKAKELHDRMEALCKPFVDFSQITALTREILARMFP